ncbi:MAG: 4-diphosphocytidyl-2-C-methyl-D-erythritol kinase [Methyloligella sp.]|nr:MAG: 4-diphosphocytidyl-2-C-methyl-D-erythritol kinase [Methyloligella sp.]
MTNFNGARFQDTAWAKVNLSLSILGKRDDGYHQLESLVVFADLGDELTIDTEALDVPSSKERSLQLNVTGPEAQNIEGVNLVETVGLQLIDEFSSTSPHSLPIVSVSLEKLLPVAAGLGGGSADAAALIRLFCQLMKEQDVDASKFDSLKFASRFGADIPVCVNSEPAFMHGVGELVEPVKSFPSIGLLLVNPRISVPTGLVFETLKAKEYNEKSLSKNALLRRYNFDFHSIGEVIDYMQVAPNDLLKPALKIAPKISDVLAEISLLDRCLISRLSGSGATCFGLFETEDEAKRAGKYLKMRYPEWWIEGTFIRPYLGAAAV